MAPVPNISSKNENKTGLNATARPHQTRGEITLGGSGLKLPLYQHLDPSVPLSANQDLCEAQSLLSSKASMFISSQTLHHAIRVLVSAGETHVQGLRAPIAFYSHITKSQIRGSNSQHTLCHGVGPAPSSQSRPGPLCSRLHAGSVLFSPSKDC